MLTGNLFAIDSSHFSYCAYIDQFNNDARAFEWYKNSMKNQSNIGTRLTHGRSSTATAKETIVKQFLVVNDSGNYPRATDFVILHSSQV